jgi:sulfide-dependent adenosine diphosphate thiazole synthase
MKLDDVKISKAIIETYTKKLIDHLEVDVAIVGAGPAGLCCAYYLAKKGKKVAVFERKLSVGGGMWGGGIMFNEIVVQTEAKKILDTFDVRTTLYEKGYYMADSVETVSTMCSKAVKAGAKIFNLMSAEDVMVRGKRVCGLVLNWTAVEMGGLHVDPISMSAKYVVDATGHAAEIAHIVARKNDIKLKTKTGKIMGEGSMHAEKAEAVILQNSKELCDGVYTAGMCANAVHGANRMGPIFGGMLLSGQKIATELLKKLK